MFQKPDHYKTQKRIWDLVNSERSTWCPRKWAGVNKTRLSLGGKSMKTENKAKEEGAWGQDRASVGGTIWSLTWSVLRSGHWMPPPPPFWWEGDGASLGAQWLIFLHPWFRKILMYPSSPEWKVLKLSLEDRFAGNCFGGGQTTWYLEQGEKQSLLFS